MNNIENKSRLPMYYVYGMIPIVIWSSTFAFSKVCLEAFSAPVLSMYRFIFAGLFMLVFAIVKKIGMPAKEDIPVFILSAVIGFSLYQLVFNKGIDMLTSATACIIIATTPVITAVFARILFKEKIRVGGWIGMMICFAGILVLMLWNGVFSINGGIFWMLGAAGMLAGYTLLQRKLTKRYTALQATAYSIIIGAVMLLFVMPFGGIEQAAHASLKVWLCTAYLGFIGSSVSYLCWSKALALTDQTAKVSNLQFIQPILAMFWGFLLVAEVPTMDMYLGLVIVVIGLTVFNKTK